MNEERSKEKRKEMKNKKIKERDKRGMNDWVYRETK